MEGKINKLVPIESIYNTWITQMRKGVLKLFLMVILDTQPPNSVYGYLFIEILESKSQKGIIITEGTIYPLLRRMSQENLIEGKWEINKDSGKRRKYYNLTHVGHKLLPLMKDQWQVYAQTYQKLMEAAN